MLSYFHQKKTFTDWTKEVLKRRLPLEKSHTPLPQHTYTHTHTPHTRTRTHTHTQCPDILQFGKDLVRLLDVVIIVSDDVHHSVEQAQSAIQRCNKGKPINCFGTLLR